MENKTHEQGLSTQPLNHLEDDLSSSQNSSVQVKKKHSLLGIISTIIVGVMLIGSIVSIMIITSGVNDYKLLAELTPYTYDELIDIYWLDNHEHQDMMDGADIKFGIAIIIGVAAGLGYFIGFILGLIGLVKSKDKKLFAILGLVLSLLLPIVFLITGLVILAAPAF